MARTVDPISGRLLSGRPDFERSRAERRRSRRATAPVLAILPVLLVAWPVSAAGSDGGTLVELLDRLRAEGMPIVYSSRLVRGDLEVSAAIEASRDGLERALAEHGLALEEGPGGVLMVIAGERRPARRAPRARTSATAPTPRQADAPVPLVIHERIEVVRDQRSAALAPGLALATIDLAEQPVAAEPSALAGRSPGVVADRVDVGGSERGRQATLTAPAASVADNTYFIDGVETTDRVAAGYSVLFFDLDQLASFEVSTGGADVTAATAGVAVRMLTKRGEGAWRGSLKGSRTVSAASFQPAAATGGRSGRADRVDRVEEAGAEAGGPLLADRLFAWAALSGDRIDGTVAGGNADDTTLAFGVLKLNAQPTRHDSLVFSAIGSDKRKGARGVGIARAPEASWRQTTPSVAYKAEHSRLFAGHATLTSRASRLDTDFSLIGGGGSGDHAPESLLGVDGVWQSNTVSGSSARDADRFEVDGEAFFHRGRADHTLGFGTSYRRFHNADDFGWPGGRDAFRVACEVLGTCPSNGDDGTDLAGDLIVFHRRERTAAQLEVRSAWAQDAVTTARSTLSFGLRFDHQRGRVLGGSVDANSAVPELLPAVTTGATDGGFAWSTVVPRLALARAFGRSGGTVLRLSFARFAGQLANHHVLRLDPINQTSASFLFHDLDDDGDWQAGEPLELVGVRGVDRLDPLAVGSPNRTDPGLDPELTDELTAAVERELGGRFSLRAHLTWRRVHGIHQARTLVRDLSGQVRPATRDDFVLSNTIPIAVPGAGFRTAELFALRDDLLFTGGTLLENGERERRYLGLTLSLVRRLDRRAMVRGHLHWGRASWRVPAAFDATTDPSDLLGSGDNDGHLFAPEAPRGRGSELLLSSTWSASVDGLVRIAPDRRWGFAVSGNLFARQGYPVAYYASFFAPDQIARDLQLTRSLDEIRNHDLMQLDLRIAKDLALKPSVAATVSLDVLNAFDSRTVLETVPRAPSPLAGQPERTLPARTLRLGLRLTWR